MSHIADRYTHAITSSNLKVEARRSGDVDLLIAAGWVRETLASMLYRLRTEYDRVDRKALQHSRESPMQAWLVLHRIPSFAPTKLALSKFIKAQASRRPLHLAVEREEALVNLLLEQLLDPQCPKCHGVAYKVVPNTPHLSAVPCTTCEGTGKRRLTFYGNKGHEYQEFALDLEEDLQRKMQRLERLLQKFLR